MLRQLSNQVKGNVDDMLERTMCSSFSRGRREAKQLDKVNGTRLSHCRVLSGGLILTRSDTYKIVSVHKNVSSPFFERKSIQYRNMILLSFSFFYCTYKYWSHLTTFNPTGILSFQTETETACLSGVGLADKILPFMKAMGYPTAATRIIIMYS